MFNISQVIKVGVGQPLGQRDPAPALLADRGRTELVDDDLVVLMHYDDAGQFLGGESPPKTETPRYVAARDTAWAAATPFEPWWAARPQYHRATGLTG